MDNYQRFIMNEPSGGGGGCNMGCLEFVLNIVGIIITVLVVYGVITLLGF